MVDIKTQKQLAGDEHWPFIPVVTVPGGEGTSQMPEGATQPEGEAVVQTWQRVAVLQVEPAAEVYWGFMAGDHVQLMNVPVQLMGGKLGVRVGDGEVKFFVIPVDLRSRLKLSLVEVTSMDDSKYAELPLY